MNRLFLRVQFGISQFIERIDAQDMVEYALSTAVIGFGSVAAMRTLSSSVASVFANVSTIVTTYIH